MKENEKKARNNLLFYNLYVGMYAWAYAVAMNYYCWPLYLLQHCYCL